MRTILPHTENPRLREKAKDVDVKDIPGAHIQGLIREMSALLAAEEYGVALAAPQVGEPLRLFIVSGRALARGSRNAPDLPDMPAHAGQAGNLEKKDEPEGPPPPDPSRKGEAEADQVYINPTLLKVSRVKKKKHEGCLSVRGMWGLVPRSEKATIRALNEKGEEFTRGASGFLAHIFQHEMDHLEGILYMDKASDLYEDAAEK
jgi:peptide deformylase